MRYFSVAITCCALALTLSGCNGSSNSIAPAPTLPVNSNPPATYTTKGTVALPGIPPATGIFSFDIGFVEPSTAVYLLADRNNKGVDVVGLGSLSLVMIAGQGTFTGIGIGTTANTGGPNGVVGTPSGIVYAGDGNATTKVFNYITGTTLANIPMVNPYTGPNLTALAAASPGIGCGTTAGVPTTGAANLRADEVAYDPQDGLVLMIMDAACPAFGAFISTSTNTQVGAIAFLTATGGAEQPVWDPGLKKFFLALPSTLAHPGGEIEIIDPKTFAVTGTFAEPGGCNANGLALGANETLFLGCSSIAPLVLMNAVTGATVATVPNTGGCDEVWYNPTADRFYAACSNFPTPSIFVVSATGTLLATIPTAVGGAAHSVAVDPFADRIFAPQRAAPIGLQWYNH